MRRALVPFQTETTIAIIENALIAEDLMNKQVPREELLAFIESWDEWAKRARTSVLISL